ncbi:hypothetical protein ACQ4PT_010499 [Festuca glaucescens]
MGGVPAFPCSRNPLTNSTALATGEEGGAVGSWIRVGAERAGPMGWRRGRRREQRKDGAPPATPPSRPRASWPHKSVHGRQPLAGRRLSIAIRPHGDSRTTGAWSTSSAATPAATARKLWRPSLGFEVSEVPCCLQIELASQAHSINKQGELGPADRLENMSKRQQWLLNDDRTMKRSRLLQKKHLYLVMDDWDEGFSIHKIDFATLQDTTTDL